MKKTHTILFGNGLNRLSPGCPSWSELLASIDNKTRRCKDFDNLPFTFQYEILLPDDYYHRRGAFSDAFSSGFDIGVSMESKIKERICQILGKMEPNNYYKQLAELDAGNYITTNYEYLLHQVFNEAGAAIEFEGRETKYSLHRRACVEKPGRYLCNIWSIHGELNKPKTMMLGLDHYCESIGKIEEYLKGLVGGMKPQLDSLEKRFRKDELDDEMSWIDTFFSTDVHIVGHGLDYSETDIWWLLNRRMRLFKKLDTAKYNAVSYYGKVSIEKAHLLNKFGVDYIEVPVKNDDYLKQYSIIFEKMRSIIGTR